MLHEDTGFYRTRNLFADGNPMTSGYISQRQMDININQSSNEPCSFTNYIERINKKNYI